MLTQRTRNAHTVKKGTGPEADLLTLVRRPLAHRRLPRVGIEEQVQALPAGKGIPLWMVYGGGSEAMAQCETSEHQSFASALGARDLQGEARGQRPVPKSQGRVHREKGSDRVIRMK